MNTIIDPMSAIATALPFGYDSYECFVSKGACRKCGNIAYGKRKCQRCNRKYCSSCEPNSLQKYGDGVEEECCVGCEPYLVVTPAEAEPIFELEPESETIALKNSPDGKAVFAPLSAIAGEGDGCVSLDKGTSSPPTSTSTLSTDSDSESDEQTKNSIQLAPPPTLYCPEPACQDRLYPDGTCRSCSYNQRILRTPPRPNRCTTALDDPWSLQPPLTPDAGCCTACHIYSTGKTPCPTCGTKYCHEPRCQQYLYPDLTCVKCQTKPRPSLVPELPIQTGCCAGCQQYAMGKTPCETCGTKYCTEVACQAYLFSNGTCARCHGNWI